MSFLDDEGSVEDSSPREGLEIILPAVTYRVALGTRNLVIDGRTYTAAPSGRGEVGVSSSGDSRALVITLPMSHAVCARYMAGGVPPRQILINVWRQQVVSGDTELAWSGYVTSMAPDGHVGNFHVPSRSGESLMRRLPTITASKWCPHVLYDANCRMVREDYIVTTTVASVNGRVVTCSDIGAAPDNWADFGELLHVDSGERMTIQTQVGVIVTMQLQIYELRIGDVVKVYAGCDHTVATCRDKFANVVNYGGFPDLPSVNPYTPGGFGIYTS